MTNIEVNQNTKKWLVRLAIFSMFAFAILFDVWRLPFGYADADESFALAVPFRFCLGEAPLVDEWGLAQLSHLVTYPIVWLYWKMMGSLEGVVIYSRWCFCVTMVLAGLFHYFCWRRVSWLGAAIGSTVFMLFAPFSIMALVYYSLEVIFLSLVVSIYFTRDRGSVGWMIAMGVCFAIATMAIPYVAAIYFVYTIVSLFITRRVREWLCVTLGISIIAFTVLSFILSRASISDIVVAVPHIFNDHSHLGQSIFKSIVIWFGSIAYQQKLYTPLMILGLLLLGMLWRSIKNKSACARSNFVFVCISFFILWVILASIFSRAIFPDFILFPIAAAGIFFGIMGGDRKYKGISIGIAVVALADSFLSCLASNQDFIRVSTCMATILVPSCAIMFHAVLSRMEYRTAPIKAFLFVFGVVVICLMSYTRYYRIFWDGHMSAMKVLITEGSHKGVITSEGKSEAYRSLKQVTDQMKSMCSANDRVLFVHMATPGYLLAERKIGGHTAWIDGRGHEPFERLKEYFLIHPQNMPKAVVFNAEDNELECDFESIGYVRSVKHGDWIVFSFEDNNLSGQHDR